MYKLNREDRYKIIRKLIGDVSSDKIEELVTMTGFRGLEENMDSEYFRDELIEFLDEMKFYWSKTHIDATDKQYLTVIKPNHALGRFLESPDDEQCSLQEFISMNSSLATNYYNAVINENFDVLGDELNDSDIWHKTMSNVCKWIIFDGQTDQTVTNSFEKLYNGTIITRENRPFITACREHGWYKLVDGLSGKAKIKSIKAK